MMSTTKPLTLLLEDDDDLASIIEAHLKRTGFAVRRARDISSADEWATREVLDIAIIDRNLPDGDGLELCRQLRKQQPKAGIIMLTCLGETNDRIMGLNAGADDYIAKPFNVDELMARVASVMRRTASSSQGEEAEIVERGALYINKTERTAKFRGGELDLSPTEFDLLTFLAENPGKAFSRSELLTRVWRYSLAGYEHTVNAHIGKLRAKLGDDPYNPRYIVTVWKVGYRFDGTEDTA